MFSCTPQFFLLRRYYTRRRCRGSSSLSRRRRDLSRFISRESYRRRRREVTFLCFAIKRECHLLSKMSRFECCVFVFLSSSSNVYQNGIITCMFFLSHRRRKKLYRDNISASETARAHSAVPPRPLRSLCNNNVYLFSCCNGTRDSPPRWRLSSSSSPSSFFFSSSISFSCL